VTPSVQALAKERMLCGDREWVWIKNDSDKGTSSTTSIGSSTSTRGGDGGTVDNSAKQSTHATAGSAEADATEDVGGYSFSDSTPRQLTQFHLTVSAKLRLASLVAFLVQRVHQKERVVVFLSTCASVDYHYELLRAMDSILSSSSSKEEPKRQGIFDKRGTIYKLHGSVPHAERQHVLANFAKESATQSAAVLLATDVAARGLNLLGVDWTVQYDPPCEVADYVHRVGRVARAGKAGQSLLFLLPSEQAFLTVLEQKGVKTMIPLSLASTLNQAAKVCPAATQAGMEHAGGGRGGGGGGKSDKNRDSLTDRGSNRSNNSRSGEAFCAEVQFRLEECVAQEDARVKAVFKETPKRKRGDQKKPEGELLQLARTAFLSHIRAYPTKEKCIKPIFSARALHLGHVARSFALKEPPKALASSKHRGGAASGTTTNASSDHPADDGQARQPSSMAFREFNEEENDADGSSRPPAKRTKRGASTNTSISRSERDANRVKHSKALLLANAAKMQSNGLESF
jgi:ATP-dependent RNA helicase DDX31/DBP7